MNHTEKENRKQYIPHHHHTHLYSRHR